MAPKQNRGRRAKSNTSWDPLADWYDGWVGKDGSQHHQKLAVPTVLELLDLKKGEFVLDVGAGQGVLAPFIIEAGSEYTGVELSPRLLEMAKAHHTGKGRFIKGDARYLSAIPELEPQSFDAAVFLLSIQDMDPLDEVVESAAWALRPGGRLVLLMTHPCFRIPRQSGWGFDENRKLQYRRVDRYLTPLPVPLKAYPGKKGVSHSFHRPLELYINTLAEYKLWIEKLVEIPTYQVKVRGERAKAENLANKEIPLFLGIRARKVPAELV